VTARHLLTLTAFAALSAWVSAQGPGTGLTASEHLAQLKTNRTLLEELVDHGLSVSGQNTSIDRANACLEVTERLAREIRSAVLVGDADRLAEMTDLLNRVVSGGVMPNLTTAHRDTPVGSPGYERVLEVHRKASGRLGVLVDEIPTVGEFGTKPRTKAAREQLAAVAGEVVLPAR
jgi:hypothetical protein